MKPVTKAIICAAGQGTRFLPMTKAMPKEMLPIIDKPIIQYVVEEAVAAGITDIIVVGSSTKRSIEDHFDHQMELETSLRAKGKGEMADKMHAVGELANFVYLRQKPHNGSLGNAVPVLNASHLINDEPYLVLFADDFFNAAVPRSVQLVEAFNQVHKPVIAMIEVEAERAGSYGIADIASQVNDATYRLNGLIEMPAPSEAPRYNDKVIASVGGYVLTPEVMAYLKDQAPDGSGEIVLANALNRLAHDDEVYGRVIDGRYHDAGNKEKYLEAIVDIALSDQELGPEFRTYLERTLKS
jgi:UTP--glucose-1-phosphate uridylyltransferase